MSDAKFNLSGTYNCGPKRGRYENSEEIKYLFLLGLLGEEHCLDVGQNTTLSDGNSGEQFVQLLIVTDGELQMSRDDTGLLVVTGSIAGELEYLSCQVFHDSGEVHWCTSSYTFSIVALT